MPKPKLLVLGSTFPKTFGDGTPSFVLDLAIEQAKRFDVTVLAPMVIGAKAQEVMAGVKVIRYRYWQLRHTLADGAILDNLKAKKTNWLQVPFLFLGLIGAIRKLNPTLIHAHWIIPQGIAATIAAPKAKLLVTTHGGDIYALNNPILQKLKKSVLRKAAAISTVNSEMKDRLVFWGIAESKISVLPMGVDLQAARIQAQRKPHQLAVVGRLVEKKGIGYLLDALKLGRENGSLPQDLELVIAGDGPWRSQLEATAKGLPVRFLGNQTKDQIRELFASSQIALLPSVTASSGDQEGLPVTLLEAGAAGCFVIASNLPGINEVVIDGITGLLIPQRDPGAILFALERAFSDANLVVSCQSEIRAKVADFDHGVVGAKYSELLESIQ